MELYSIDQLYSCLPHGRCSAEPKKIFEHLHRRGIQKASEFRGCFLRRTGLRVSSYIEFEDLHGKSPTAIEMNKMLHSGPVLLGINSKEIKSYKGEPLLVTESPDHTVVLVAESRDSWLLRNSWGDWGDDGYFWISKNSTIHYAIQPVWE